MVVPPYAPLSPNTYESGTASGTDHKLKCHIVTANDYMRWFYDRWLLNKTVVFHYFVYDLQMPTPKK